jgi:hypothetical protein
VKGYQRRAAGVTVQFKLMAWDAMSCTWRAGRKCMGTEAEARALAKAPGRYRVERFEGGRSMLLEPFEVGPGTLSRMP